MLAATSEFNEFKSWDNVLNETKEKIIKHSAFHEFDKDAIIYRESELISSVYLILSGFVLSYRVSINGKEKHLYHLSKGDFLNLCAIDGRASSSSAKVLSGASLISIDKDVLLKLMMEDFKLNMLIINSLTLKVRRCQRQILNMGAYTSNQRIASRLWKLSRDYGKKINGYIYIDFPINQTDISNMVGTSRETVNRFLGELTSKEIIIREGNTIAIIDRNKLLEYIYK